MKRGLTIFAAAHLLWLAPALLQAQSAAAPALSDPPARYDEERPSPDFHRSRRAAVLDALPGDAVAIVLSAPTRNRSNDVDFQYRQSNSLYYLTGMTEPGSVLFLVPAGVELDGRAVREILVVPERDAAREAWMGRRLGAERAQTELGVAAAVPAGRFEEIAGPLLESHRPFVLPWPEAVPERSELASQVAWLADRMSLMPMAGGRAGFMQRAMLGAGSEEEYGRIRAGLERMGGAEALGASPAADMARAFLEAGGYEAWAAWKEAELAGYADATTLGSLLDRLREVKTEEELRFLQRAVDITAAAQREAIRSIEPGLHEYEIEAVIEYVFHREGAEYTGFPSIVGSGENSIILHYESNRRRMEDGDVVVMDLGAEYRGYSADITRTVPVSGRFSEEQRHIYEAVLEAQEAAIAAAVPGATMQELNSVASGVLATHLQALGLIDRASDVRRFFPHGISHYLGLDVHDAGTYGPFRAGTVITVEPGLYIAPQDGVDPRWWNIGVRIEDDVVVTEDGPRVLSGAAPKAVDEIEALMREPGLASVPAGR